MSNIKKFTSIEQQHTIKKLRIYLKTIFKELNHKRMSPDSVLKSIRHEFYTNIPNDYKKKGVVYRFVLEHLKGFFKKTLYQKDELAIIDGIQIIKKDGKNLTFGEMNELNGAGFFNGEMFHKINAELEKLEEDLEDKNWIGIFHSKEHYEAFEYILSSFAIEEHTKKLFSGFWYEFGGNQKLTRCTAKTYTEWVYKQYLPHEEKKSENLTRSHCGYSHQFRRQIRRYKATYKDQNIFIESHNRK